MATFHSKPDWHMAPQRVTSEDVFLGRRHFIKTLGAGSVGLSLGLMGGGGLPGGRAWAKSPLEKEIDALPRLKSKKNRSFAPKQPLTDELYAANYTNFYEFSTDKGEVAGLATKLKTRPWTLEVKGLVGKPRTFDIDALIKMMPLEERVYRFRCVEAWSMVVPWIGFPLKKLLAMVEPLSGAKYVKFQTFFNPEISPRQKKGGFFTREPWPYTEGLSMAEAMNDLTLFTVGSYGHVLPNQHGAPIRLITPWKYGFKSIKSVVGLELTSTRPATFWNTIAPGEYGFVSNVNPKVPHPRWSQASERVLGKGTRIPTLMYNGYGAQVAHMYKG